MAQFFHDKTVVCSAYSNNLKHYEKRLQQKILPFRSSPCQMFIKREFKTHRKTNVPKSLFDEVGSFLQPASLLKQRR